MQLLKFLSVSSAAFLVATAKPVHKRAENNRCQAVNAGSLARQLQELKSAGNPGLVPLNIPSFEPETVVSLYYNGLRVPYGKDLDPLVSGSTGCFSRTNSAERDFPSSRALAPTSDSTDRHRSSPRGLLSTPRGRCERCHVHAHLQ